MQGFSYRRLPGIVARTMSSDTEPIPVFSAFCCLGLRASLLPFRFAMTASFLTAPCTAAWQLAARLIQDVKGMSLARCPRLHEPGLDAVFRTLPERKPHFGESNHRRILARMQAMSNRLCSKRPLAGRHSPRKEGCELLYRRHVHGDFHQGFEACRERSHPPPEQASSPRFPHLILLREISTKPAV